MNRTHSDLDLDRMTLIYVNMTHKFSRQGFQRLELEHERQNDAIQSVLDRRLDAWWL